MLITAHYSAFNREVPDGFTNVGELAQAFRYTHPSSYYQKTYSMIGSDIMPKIATRVIKNSHCVPATGLVQ